MKRSSVVLALLLLSSTAWAAPHDERSGYLAPVLARGELEPDQTLDGATFPVARSRWLSIINFTNDWHAPRMRRIDGTWQQVGIHEGTDIFAEPGTPIRAVVGGAVERVGWTFYSGWRVGIRDPFGRYWFYAHMRTFADDINVGARVEAGDRLGGVGNTGYGAEPGHKDEFTHHLHLGIQHPDGHWVNPYPLMRKLYASAVEAAR